MGKQSSERNTLHHDFAFANDAALNTQIAAFAAQHEAANGGERLAMDSRKSLGPGKVRVTFRIVPRKGGR